MALATPIWRATVWLAPALFFVGPGAALAAPATQAELVAYADKTFQEAQARHQKAPGDVPAAWQLGRACFDLAEFATNKTQRASLAEQGIAACEQAIARQSNSAPAHYYLGMNLGELAETKGLSALGLVKRMQREFTHARDMDERLDWAGPDRSLGLLYREAPAFGSIGSRSKARKHLQRAEELAPQYPENGLNLLETYLQWGERKNAQRELAALEQLWPSAHTNFTGMAWAASWAQWEPLLARLKAKLAPPAKALGTPHDKN
jgi:tetratricopeptide (TPR) repeat protein